MYEAVSQSTWVKNATSMKVTSANLSELEAEYSVI